MCLSFYQDKSPLAPVSSTTTTTGRTTIKRFPLKQKIRAVNIKALQLPNINNPSQGIKDLEIRLLQVECEELKNQLGCLRVNINSFLLLKPNYSGELLNWKGGL